MDIQMTAKEIGLFETAMNLATVSTSENVIQTVGAAMPLPAEDIENRMIQAAQWLLDFGKNKYLFLLPELAIVEQMKKRSNRKIEIIIGTACNLEQEAKCRLYNNFPNGIATILEEPYFPECFYPDNGMIIITGYLGANKAMVLKDTYRMADHYDSFLGKKVFIPYQELNRATRCDGWLEIAENKTSIKWRYNDV